MDDIHKGGIHRMAVEIERDALKARVAELEASMDYGPGSDAQRLYDEQEDAPPLPEGQVERIVRKVVDGDALPPLPTLNTMAREGLWPSRKDSPEVLADLAEAVALLRDLREFRTHPDSLHVDAFLAKHAKGGE